MFDPRRQNHANLLTRIRVAGLLAMALWAMSLALLVSGNASAATGWAEATSTQAAVCANPATTTANAATMTALSGIAIETVDFEGAPSPSEPEEEVDRVADHAATAMVVPFQHIVLAIASPLSSRRLYCGRAPPGRQ